MRFFLATTLFALCATPTWSQGGLRTRRTKEAIIKANTDAKVAMAVGQRIDNFCAVFDDWYKELGLKKKSDNKLVARVFNTYEEFETIYKRNNSGEPPLAYFSRSLNAIVLYNDEKDVTLRQTLFHEASHQYLNRYTSDAPSWFNEGLAEYFEGWRMTPDGRLIEQRANLFDLTILQKALEEEEIVAPRELVALPWERFRSFSTEFPKLHPYLHYATSWSLVWFSLEAGTEEDRERMVEYLHDLNKKGPSAKFVIEDWNDFEQRWRAFVLETSAEPADANDNVLLGAGHRSSGSFKEAIERYEAAYEADPDLPGVEFWLGYCSGRLGRDKEALGWFERAREREPENPSVPYQMAQVALSAGDIEVALEHAQAASELSGDEVPGFLELLAVCQLMNGDKRQAQRTLRKILKLVETDEEEAYYKALQAEIKRAD